jgi:hypothetical protein
VEGGYLPKRERERRGRPMPPQRRPAGAGSAVRESHIRGPERLVQSRGGIPPPVTRATAAGSGQICFDFSSTASTRTSLAGSAGNTLLCTAAGKGCLPLVQALVGGASANPRWQAELFFPWDRNDPAIFSHQSVGCAVVGNQADVVEYLCRDPGIRPHLEYRNQHGRTVFHQAARYGSPRMFELLARHYPEGVNLRSTLDPPLTSSDMTAMVRRISTGAFRFCLRLEPTLPVSALQHWGTLYEILCRKSAIRTSRSVHMS